MEQDPLMSDWIHMEDEAEAERARARMIRRVSIVRDHPMLNLTEASAYPFPSLSLPSTSPVTHTGNHPLDLARAPTPTNHALMDPQGDKSDEMDCSEDVARGTDGWVDTPSAPSYILFAQHLRNKAQESHN